MNAIITVDFIKEILHPDGKLAGKGYAAFEREHCILRRVNEAISAGRERRFLVVHVRLGFEPGFPAHPVTSPLLGRAKEFGALELGTWGTEYCDELDVRDEDVQVVKQRVSPFFGTQLESILRSRQIENVFVAGVATDLAVESATRDAHDRDFGVTVLADCCAAAIADDHHSSLKTLAKIADVSDLAETSLR